MFSVSQAAARHDATANPTQTGTVIGVTFHWSPRNGEAGSPTDLPMSVESLSSATSIRVVANLERDPSKIMEAFVSKGQAASMLRREMPHVASLDDERAAKCFLQWLKNLADRKVRINRKTSFLQYLAPKDLVAATPKA